MQNTTKTPRVKKVTNSTMAPDEFPFTKPFKVKDVIKKSKELDKNIEQMKNNSKLMDMLQSPQVKERIKPIKETPRFNVINQPYTGFGTISDKITIDDQTLDLSELIQKHQQNPNKPSVPNGLPGISDSMTVKTTKIGKMINSIVKYPKHRDQIVKLVSGFDLDELINKSFDEDAINDLGIDYVRGVVATSSILSNYKKFLIWKAGVDFVVGNDIRLPMPIPQGKNLHENVDAIKSSGMYRIGDWTKVTA